MSFFEDVQSLAACKVFVRALPVFVKLHPDAPLSMIIKSADKQVGFGISFPASCADRAEELTSELMSILKKEERLMELELLADEMRNVGVAPDILDPMLAEAEKLARELHPD